MTESDREIHREIQIGQTSAHSKGTFEPNFYCNTSKLAKPSFGLSCSSVHMGQLQLFLVKQAFVRYRISFSRPGIGFSFFFFNLETPWGFQLTLSRAHCSVLTWRLRVRYPYAACFLSIDFSSLTSNACQKSSQWFLKEQLCPYWCEKPRNNNDNNNRRH